MSKPSHTVTVTDQGFSVAGTLELSTLMPEGEKTLRFEMNGAPRPSNDSIAAATALLLGRGNAGITFNFPVSEHTAAAISQHCQCLVEASASPPVKRFEGASRVGLAFSGGFDSLMARDLLPTDTELISLDFGGRFARERDMFKLFDSHVVGTNLVDIGMNRNSWTFMAAANVLLRDSLGLSTLSFGTVTEARPKYLRFAGQKQPVGSSMDAVTEMPIFNPVLGLTEVATAQYATTHHGWTVGRILASVANPGEEKAYRKNMLLHAVKSAQGGSPGLGVLTLPPNPVQDWGQNIAGDFLSLYLMKQLGAGAVQTLYRAPIPDAALSLVGKLSLDFYGKVNTNFYQGCDPEMQAGMYRNLLLAGVEPYSSKDFQEFAQVAALLG